MALENIEILKALQNAVAEINLSLPADRQISSDPDAVLFGDGSALDSVGLVNVVMAAEQHLADQSGTDIVLASEAAMSRKRSPYRTLGRLAEFAAEVLAEDEAA